ncbi:Exostosin family protein [Tritrichomonas foetus]|uniref:Exostosin family protein n=1 Tax=Tritrichomonas foetus TaxID=1144522 RepID=A0A1J4JR44_9EUKA|nr:Exostosin family protein [Tritrichomonas foetus]|eukprot:OHT01585.1 Exostosin family protein [Tritrichomonas foetus]
MRRDRNFALWIFGVLSICACFFVFANIVLFVQLHFTDPSMSEKITSNNLLFEIPKYIAKRYEIDPDSPSPSLHDHPKWPPFKVYVYPEDKYHTEECLYPPELPLRYVNESGYWFQRMLEPTIHHQFLHSPIITSNPEEADLFFIPHYSRMCSGLDGNHRWNQIQQYVNKYGTFFNRYSGSDHFIMHSVPHYGDKPADKAVSFDQGPMIGILDLRLSSIKSNPWLLSRTTIVPFITHPENSNVYGNFENNINNNVFSNFQANSFENERPISVFVAMSTSTKGLKASSAILRQKIEEQFLNISNSEIVRIDRKNYTTFKKALESLPSKMKSSQFCIVPPGDAPSSKRFYDAISYSCVPFMLADYFILPYEDIAVDYEKCMKQLPAKDVWKLANILNSFTQKETSELRRNLAAVKEKFTWNYRKKPIAGQALWTLAWSLYDKIQMLKPYENNEMTGYDNDPPFDIFV